MVSSVKICVSRVSFISYDWLIDVSNEYDTKHMLCGEHLEPVLNGSETCSLDSDKAHDEVPKGTVDYGLKYDVNQKINLHGYVDSDWAGSAIDRKSTSGCCFSLGSGMISWFSRKQSCVALSTAKAKYVAACSASCEAVWLQKLLSDLFDLWLDVTCIFCANQICTKLLENPMFHDKLKNIEIKFHYIKDMFQRGEVKLQYVIQIKAPRKME